MAFAAANKNPPEVTTLVLRVFGNHESAELAAANLNAHGIDCQTSADDCGGLMPIMAGGGVKLIVRSGDARPAEAILDSSFDLAGPAVPEEATVKIDEPVPDLPKFIIVAGIWTIFGLGLIGNIVNLCLSHVSDMNDMEKFVYFWLSAGGSTLCVYMLYRSVKNYIIHKNKATDGRFAE